MLCPECRLSLPRLRFALFGLRLFQARLLGRLFRFLARSFASWACASLSFSAFSRASHASTYSVDSTSASHPSLAYSRARLKTFAAQIEVAFGLASAHPFGSLAANLLDQMQLLLDPFPGHQPVDVLPVAQQRLVRHFDLALGTLAEAAQQSRPSRTAR